MSRQLLVSLASLAAIVAVAGCGGGDSSADQSTTAVEQRNTASVSVIRAEDLPAEAKKVESFSNPPCAPLEVLDKDDSQTAESAMFAVGPVRIQEAVGVFTGAGSARDAYNALNATSRLTCIRETIELQGDLTVEISPLRDLDSGDEAEAVLFKVSGDSSQLDSVGVVSIRAGHSVASLIFIEEEPVGPSLLNEVVAAATEQLARAKSKS